MPDSIVTVSIRSTSLSGRGFGPATRAAAYDIDIRRAGGIRVPGAGGRVQPVSLEKAGKVGLGLHERFRCSQAGAITRT